MKVSITFYVQFPNEGKRTTNHEGPREGRAIIGVLRSVLFFFPKFRLQSSRSIIKRIMIVQLARFIIYLRYLILHSTVIFFFVV